MPIPTLSQQQIIADMIKSELHDGDKISFIVASNSMHPIIGKGDTVVTEIIPGNRVKRGDILTIKMNDHFLVHRAIIHINDVWLTKGDNNTLPDPTVPMDHFIGRVITVQKTNKSINLESSKWQYINPVIAKIGELESRAFLYHQFFRFPFRILIKIFQIISILIFVMVFSGV